MSDRHDAPEKLPVDHDGEAPRVEMSSHVAESDAEWFEEWFRSDFYMKLYSHRDVEEAQACSAAWSGPS